ncbi:MAG: 5-(carboxyamino)imidazole ribonucleotide mutase [Bacteroidota bacterium]
MAKIAVVIGSESDRAVMQSCIEYLEKFGIEHDFKVLSAHRQPEETAAFARSAEAKGYSVIIAAAGMAAHLPGFLAAHTTLPVIGVPLPTSELKGEDALFSIVQMPSGVPVATMAIGAAGAKNAAILAAEIIALSDATIKERIQDFRKHGSRF